MRGNSGGGKGTDNNRNPTLRDAGRDKGVSGNAVHGEKLHDAAPDRQSVRNSSP